ncbi:MAG TPA: glycosyltransferase family 4 protein [Kiritimatiellia bacterium]|nr:glycosyltransferase family 4 protein [Kiritimatiellia bacterium]HRZ12439.1 glycosyltransferase family 4 protein [Kiritimatiellia bacterium]HSA17803.1 glycosyltransferase family 4 protein [Kiritimatiellia bacterium]
MNVLFLAPQSFYLDRGTPIAVRLLLEQFSRRGWSVDVLVFPGGRDVVIPGVRFFKTSLRPGARPLQPGLSARKLWHDVRLFFAARERLKTRRYDFIHAVEEGAFIAALLSARTGVPFVCDMDSSMPDQLAEKNRFWRLVRPVMRRFEAYMLRRARAVLAVCEAVADKARAVARGPVFVLPDPPVGGAPNPARNHVRERLKVEGPAFVYVGNLQGYQGISLLLKSFQRALAHMAQACLIIVGGELMEVEKLERRCNRHGFAGHVHFTGACALDETVQYLDAADVLISPRIRGANTPMKIYSYMQSGKAILATDIPSHTQVLTPEAAVLVPPQPEAMAEAMVKLASDADLRERLGQAARRLAETQHSRAAYERKADEFCAWMESNVA